jgi:hypothetical protein
MAKIEIKRPFPGKSANECYKAILSLVGDAGYKIFKKRDVAWLVICEGKVQDNPVNLTLSIPFGSPTSVSLILSGESAGETVLQSEAERLFSLLAKKL